MWLSYRIHTWRNNALIEIRVRFERREQIKYIAHLDIMKVFERALRRSGLPASYSKGFNPHPGIVFGLPLSLGLVSYSEYADFEMNGEVESDELKTRLNSQLPEGLLIVAAKRRSLKDNIMASVDLAEYEIDVCSSMEMGKIKMSGIPDILMKADVLAVEKTTKSGRSVVDIKNMIKSLKITDRYDLNATGCNPYTICAGLSAGSRANLKPETLLMAMRIYAGYEGSVQGIRRTGLFIKKGSEYLEPFDERVL